MKKLTLKKSALMAALWIVIALLALTGAAFAWFTFTSSANVEPMQGRISSEGINLLISNSPDGPFDKSCELVLINNTLQLTPITTEDLELWRVPLKQDKEGGPLGYRALDGNIDTYLMHGKLYLTNIENNCEFVLDGEGSSFGENALTLEALRFGIKAVSPSGSYSAIYDISSGEWKNAVLGRINSGDIAAIDYWLWLEGEDPECTNAVASSDIALQLQFSGKEIK